MKRTFCSFPVHDFLQTKERMLNWANQFGICCFLDNHQYPNRVGSFECILAVNAADAVQVAAGRAFEQLQAFVDRHNDWCFGHLGYDLKNETEDLQSGNADFVKFDDLFFFIPEIVLILRHDELLIGMKDRQHKAVAMSVFNSMPVTSPLLPSVKIKSRFTRAAYIDAVRQLQQHILRGDCYEVNFCQEFYSNNAIIDPLQVYRSLSRESPNPFSCYYRVNGKYLLCASPERFLCKEGNRLISQPVKGTIGRGKDAGTDGLNKAALMKSAKDRSENIMVVDLVRNDLSRVCAEGSVRVEELMGIYSFPQVYQMISTISGEVEKGTHVTDLLKATFPMGSMTGAPKKRVMQLIEQYERTKRGLFSGAVGYISPGKDMDFNVVIRSILYNAVNRYLSFQTGSAITYYSRAEDEYEECLLKAEAIKRVLNG